MSSWRASLRARVGVGLAVALFVAGCGSGGQAGRPPATSPTASAPATSQAPPPALDRDTARRLLDRVSARTSFVGLRHQYNAEYDYDLNDGKVCTRPVPRANGRDCRPEIREEVSCSKVPSDRDRLVRETHQFSTAAGPPEGAAVTQDTVVYRSATAAREAVAQLFDKLERCRREVVAGEVTEGFAPATVPGAGGLDGRAVSARMSIPSTGSTFAHRRGCVDRGPVVQCVSVWSERDSNARRWFEKALIATARNLSANVAG